MVDRLYQIQSRDTSFEFGANIDHKVKWGDVVQWLVRLTGKDFRCF